VADRFVREYRSQLGAEILWDEHSTFEASEDVGTGADVPLRHTAAVLDQRGPANARFLAGTARPASTVLSTVLSEAERRGFGSLFHLINDLKEIRTFIADVDPSATAWTAEKEPPQDDLVAAAWQASGTISRLCAVALAHHLPLWTTG
jgi:hypothetical protein